MGVQAGELGATEPEPLLPPNLGDLSGSQASFADFFHLDSDLLAVAAKNSPRIGVEPADLKELSSWISSLPVSKKDEMLVRLMAGEEVKIGMELQSQFQRLRHASQSTATMKPRTVGELLAAAEMYREARGQEQQRKAALEKGRRQRRAAIAREKHLNALKGRAETIWTTVETLASSRLPKNYDLTMEHLLDLRDLAERESRQADFTKRLAEFRDGHAAKRSLIDRLAKAGL